MLTIDTALFSVFPGARMGILAMRGVDAKAPLAPAAAAAAAEEIRSRYGSLDRAGLKALYPMRVYAEYYKSFGYSYHVLAQLESVLSGKRTVNGAPGLLAAMFLTELESTLLTAGHDLDLLQTPLRLQVSTGEERFRSISGKEVATVPGDLMVRSGNEIISSILRGPDFASRITPETQNVLFTVYAPSGIEAQTVQSALRKLEERIRSFSPACETLDINVYPQL